MTRCWLSVSQSKWLCKKLKSVLIDIVSPRTWRYLEVPLGALYEFLSLAPLLNPASLLADLVLVILGAGADRLVAAGPGGGRALQIMTF